MADKENKNRFEESTFDKRFKEIVGIAYPPENQEQWCVVLQYAGCSLTEVHSILSTLGHSGFDAIGKLPDVWFCKYTSAFRDEPHSVPSDEIPQFSPDLLRRLESAFAEKGPLSWSGEPRDTDEASQPTNRVEETPLQSDVKHSSDFRSVQWFGTKFIFTTMQAACISILWENWKDGTPVISERTVLGDAGSASDRLRDLFDKGKHPSWGTLIKPAGKGAFQLAEPDES